MFGLLFHDGAGPGVFGLVLGVGLDEAGVRPMHRLIQMLRPDVPQQHSLALRFEIFLLKVDFWFISVKH